MHKRIAIAAAAALVSCGGSSSLEGLVPPRIPVDRIVCVLQQIGAVLEDQPVRVLGRSVRIEMARARLVIGSTCGEGGSEPLIQVGREARGCWERNRPTRLGTVRGHCESAHGLRE